MANKKVSLLLDTSRGVFIYSLVAPNNIVTPPAMVTGDVYDIELSLVKKKSNSEANTEPLPAGTYTGARFAIVAKDFTPVSGYYKLKFGLQESGNLDYNVSLTDFTTALNNIVKAHYSSTSTCVTVQESPNKDAFIIKFVGDATSPDGLLNISGESLLPKCVPLVAKIADANTEHNGVFALQLKRVPAAYVELTEATYWLDNTTEYARKPFIGTLSLNTEEMASHIFGSDTYEFLVEVELISSGSGRETVVQQSMTIGRDYIVDGAYYTSPIEIQTLGLGIYDALNAAVGASASNRFITANEVILEAPIDGTEYLRKDGAWVHPSGGGSGSFLSTTGGLMTGAISFDATGGQNINKGTFDNGSGGYNGISLNCAVGYELNWQGGRLSSYYSGSIQPIQIDSAITQLAPITFPTNGTSDSQVGAWGFGVENSSDSSQEAFIEYNQVRVQNSSGGTTITPSGITFPDSTTLSTAPVASTGLSYKQTIAQIFSTVNGQGYWTGSYYFTQFSWSGGVSASDWASGKFKVRINGNLFSFGYTSSGAQYLNYYDDTSSFTCAGYGESLYLHFDGETAPYPFLIT